MMGVESESDNLGSRLRLQMIRDAGFQLVPKTDDHPERLLIRPYSSPFFTNLANWEFRLSRQRYQGRRPRRPHRQGQIPLLPRQPLLESGERIRSCTSLFSIVVTIHPSCIILCTRLVCPWCGLRVEGGWVSLEEVSRGRTWTYPRET